ncbi:MAG: hypothetical protein ACLTOP_08780 [Collinsella phocaeensis]
MSASPGSGCAGCRWKARLARCREVLGSDSAISAAVWALAALALLAVLAWFFACSPYGAPAAPVYAEF